MSRKWSNKKKNAPRKRYTHDSHMKDPRIVRVYEYEITWEPLPEQPYGSPVPEVKEAIRKIHALIQDNPSAAIPELLQWIEKYPDVAVLRNYLASAYMLAKQFAKADALIRENYKRFPDYLFAKLGYGELCLSRGELEKIPEIFHHSFDLPLLYPGRKLFHVTEVTGFMGLMGLYFIEIGDLEMAEQYYSILQQVAPDHAMTRRLQELLFPRLPGKDWSRISA